MSSNITSRSLVLLIVVLQSGCTLTPSKCDPLIPDIGMGKALGCWITGNTEANLENMRQQIRELSASVELQEIALREIELSSDRMSRDIDQYTEYVTSTQSDLSILNRFLINTKTTTEKQNVTRQALLLELETLTKQVNEMQRTPLISQAEIEKVQADIAKRRNAIAVLTESVLID